MMEIKIRRYKQREGGGCHVLRDVQKRERG